MKTKQSCNIYINHLAGKNIQGFALLCKIVTVCYLTSAVGTSDADGVMPFPAEKHETVLFLQDQSAFA